MEQLDSFETRRIALAASCDPRTLQRALSGQPVRPLVLARIREQLKIRGLLHLLDAHGGK